jgi:hypothetical protein
LIEDVMAQTNGEVDSTLIEDDSESRALKKEKDRRANREQPIVFNNVDAAAAIEVVEKHVAELLTEDEKSFLQELKDFVLLDEGAWALGAQHLQLIGRVLYDRNIPPEVRHSMLKFLHAGALKEDIILLLHMDRRDHILMNYLAEFERMTPEEQDDVAKLICNLFDPPSASDWLLYISEWQVNNQPWSNCKVTCKVAVNALLSDRSQLQEMGVAIMYNLGTKEVFDDIATELASAILQYLHNDLSEESAFRLLSPMIKFMTISFNDVPALVKMLGPDLSKFKGKSSRVDGLVDQIEYKSSVTSQERFDDM